MKKAYRILSFLFALGAIGSVLASCDQGTTSYSTLPEGHENDLVETPITDALEFEFADDVANYNFKEEADSGKTGVIYGLIHLMGVTDGDTISWKGELGTGEASSSLRMLGIDTPESTANVDPWGVKASKFASSVLEGCYRYALVNDIKTTTGDQSGYDKMDSNGTRYMGFLWYQKTEDSAWRCYNLECIEQGYSENGLFNDSDLGYLQSFIDAGEKAKAMKLRVPGKVKDPDYDYSDNVVETTIWYIRDHYDEIGINMEAGTSGKRLRVTGLVVGMIGDNLVLRDIVRSDSDGDGESDPDGEYRSIYAYAGYGSSLGSMVGVGDIVRFYCRATKFPKDSDTIQLSDMETASYGDYKFEIMATYGSPDWEELAGEGNSIDPVVPERLPETKEELGALAGLYVTLPVQIRVAQGGEYDEDGNWIESGINSYYNKGKSGTTIYAYLDGTRIVCNLRIDHESYPRLSENDFAEGQRWEVTAYLNPYFDNYQLALLNYTPTNCHPIETSSEAAL